MSLPIWTFSKQSEEVKGARAQEAKSDALLNEERNHILHSVHTIFSELQEANKRLSLFGGGLLPLAEQSTQSGKLAYSTGKIEYASLLNLIKTRFQTELSYYEALVNYESKIAELEALLGEPLGESLK